MIIEEDDSDVADQSWRQGSALAWLRDLLPCTDRTVGELLTKTGKWVIYDEL